MTGAFARQLGLSKEIPAMSDAKKSQLRLDLLHERHIGLTASLGGTFTEAASVCLNRHHVSPVEMTVSGSTGSSTRQVEFEKPDARTLNAWSNNIDTTENGAYGMCLSIGQTLFSSSM